MDCLREERGLCLPSTKLKLVSRNDLLHMARALLCGPWSRIDPGDTVSDIANAASITGAIADLPIMREYGYDT